ncbi:hypothetical protein FNF31_02770 [Cafeteria roenbergensis]|uniref:CSC1/OSCA1-like cytosolic domain-containing protein n=2 Tax=Cafeteria roenbergensis TaxID=33653 RepID=A0A5A8E1Y3_CAFRO|nr:hypothetical protein FNF31_02770 [Cafeteria roenbergensis]KAA0171795.1 hypothetical protein FNF28_00431 [Cafeteria roenbergensis]
MAAVAPPPEAHDFEGYGPGGVARGANFASGPAEERGSYEESVDDAPRRGVAQLATTGLANSYEGLDGDDWDDLPFVPPSLPLAVDMADDDVFGGKQLNSCGTDINTLSTLGVGMGIWFRFLCLSFLFFSLCSVLSIPAFALAVQGQRIAGSSTLRSQDAFGFSLASVGNVGPSVAAVAAQNCTSGCSLLTPVVSDISLELPDATLVLVISDAVVWVCLVLFLLAFARAIRHVEDQIADNNIETASYSVMVTGLPKDATVADVRAHFDRLYNLREPDWTYQSCCISKRHGRKVFAKPTKIRTGELRAARDADGVVIAPVLNATNSGDPAYLRSWVAEVTLARPNGVLVNKYRAMQSRIARIHRLRAAAKLYSPDSPFSNPAKFAKATKVVRGAEAAMARIDARLTRRYRTDVVAAFVIFNTEESRRRAVADYAKSNGVCGRMCQPTPLRFRSSAALHQPPVPITVVPAPDPAELLWENLEASSAERCARQGLSTTAMLLITAVSLVFLVLAQQAAKLVDTETPPFAICSAEALTAAGGPSATPTTHRIVRDAGLDATCPGDSRGLYVADITGSEPVPASGISGTDPASCASMCVVPESKSPVCSGGTGGRNFTKSSLIPCFCLDTLTRAQQTGVLLTALSELANEDLCISFAATAIVRNGFVALASLVVVLVNVVLRVVADALTTFERHVSVGSRQSAKVVKILALTFLNTAVITALVNIKFSKDGVPDWISNFFGNIEGFEPQWFAVAGSSIVLTMALNVFTLNMGVLLKLPFSVCPTCRPAGAARVAPTPRSPRGSIDQMVLQPGPLVLPARDLPEPERRAAVQWAKQVRLAQSSVGCCDRLTARCCGCCGPYELCGCLVSACNVLPPSVQCWCCCRGARARGAVTQAELDGMVELPSYDIAQRWPLALNTFFVTATYGAGLPILYPFAAVAFAIAFVVEKVSLLRFSKQPPVMDASLARLSLSLMPLAVILHSVVTIIVFSDPNLLSSRSIFDRFAESSEGTSVENWYLEQLRLVGTPSDLTTRFLRESVIVPAALLLLFLLFLLIRCLTTGRCGNLTTSCCRACCCGRSYLPRMGIDDELKKMPPFTGLYTQPLPRGIKHEIGEVERKQGWRILRDPSVRGDRTAQRKIKVWTEAGMINGKPHAKGERMLTWETIADVGIASYQPTANPEYAAAFLALESAVERTELQKKLRARLLEEHAARLQQSMMAESKAGPGDAAAATEGGEPAIATPRLPAEADFDWNVDDEGVADESESGEDEP